MGQDLNIYISCPVSVSAISLLEHSRSIEKNLLLYRIKNYEVQKWNRDPREYKASMLEEADAVVFILPDNRWQYDRKLLPIGVRKELDKALLLKKNIYLAYETNANEYKLYRTSITPSSICGIMRSTEEVFEQLSKVAQTKLEMSATANGYKMETNPWQEKVEKASIINLKKECKQEENTRKSLVLLI